MLEAACLLLLLAQPVSPQPAAQRVGLLRQLGQDFRHFADRGNLVILGSGALASLAVHARDRELTNDFKNSRGLDGFFELGDFGGGSVQLAGALGAYAVGRVAHNREVRSLGGDLLGAQFASGVVTQGLKFATRRSRPDGSNRQSFPSGHASSTFATATVLERHYGWAVGIPAYAFATYVAGSRLQENKHFPSDVLCGAALGIVAGRSVTFGRSRARVALAPLAVPGGGLGVALVGAR